MYIPHEKVSNFKECINSADISDEIKLFINKTFDDVFEYSTETKSRVYTHDDYLKMKEKHGGNLGKLESNIRARKKYESKNRDEINRKARERYHAKKFISNNNSNISV